MEAARETETDSDIDIEGVWLPSIETEAVPLGEGDTDVDFVFVPDPSDGDTSGDGEMEGERDTVRVFDLDLDSDVDSVGERVVDDVGVHDTSLDGLTVGVVESDNEAPLFVTSLLAEGPLGDGVMEKVCDSVLVDVADRSGDALFVWDVLLLSDPPPREMVRVADHVTAPVKLCEGESVMVAVFESEGMSDNDTLGDGDSVRLKVTESESMLEKLVLVDSETLFVRVSVTLMVALDKESD